MYFTWLHPYRLQEKCREMIRLRILHFFIVPVLRLHIRFPDLHIACICAFRIFIFPVYMLSGFSHFCGIPGRTVFRTLTVMQISILRQRVPSFLCIPESLS